MIARSWRVLMTGFLRVRTTAELMVRFKTSSSSAIKDIKVAMRQIAGAFAQLEKARLVAKLKGARERKRATGVKVEGRKSYAEMSPEMVRLTKRLHRYPVNGQRRAALQAGIEALDKARSAAERYQTTYFGDRSVLTPPIG
jgi:DNA invertase Pin-like site-specific DNA recombinase